MLFELKGCAFFNIRRTALSVSKLVFPKLFWREIRTPNS